MKSILVLLAMLLLNQFVNAQEESEKFLIPNGTYSLGGSLSFGMGNSNLNEDVTYSDYKNFSFSIVPDAGYFVADNLMLGARLGYSFSRTTYNGGVVLSETKRNGFILSPYLKKYFSISSKLAFSLTGALEYSYNQSDDFSDDEQIGQSNSNIYEINVRPGFTYLLSDRLSLDANIAALYYSYVDYSNDGEQTRTVRQAGFNMNLNNIWLGMKYYF